MTSLRFRPVPHHTNLVTVLTMTLDDLPTLETLNVAQRKQSTSLRLATQLIAAFPPDTCDVAFDHLCALVASLQGQQSSQPLVVAREAAIAYLAAEGNHA